MKLTVLSGCIIALLLLQSCGSAQTLSFEDITATSLNIPMSLSALEFVDVRQGTDRQQDLDVKRGLFTRADASIQPPFTAEHARFAEQVIRAQLSGGDHEPKYALRVEILEAVKSYERKWFTGREEVRIKLRLIALTEGLEVTAETGGAFYYTAVKGNAERHEEIYRTTLKNTTYKAMEILQYYHSKAESDPD